MGHILRKQLHTKQISQVCLQAHYIKNSYRLNGSISLNNYHKKKHSSKCNSILNKIIRVIWNTRKVLLWFVITIFLKLLVCLCSENHRLQAATFLFSDLFISFLRIHLIQRFTSPLSSSSILHPCLILIFWVSGISTSIVENCNLIIDSSGLGLLGSTVLFSSSVQNSIFRFSYTNNSFAVTVFLWIWTIFQQY